MLRLQLFKVGEQGLAVDEPDAPFGIAALELLGFHHGLVAVAAGRHRQLDERRARESAVGAAGSGFRKPDILRR